MSDQLFSFYNESIALAHALTDRVFAYLDDPMALATHMGERSWLDAMLLENADGRQCATTCPPALSAAVAAP